MRLHNRVIRPGFWTDTELIRHLPLAGRMYYMGLVQLAEDSGCLEDDLLAHKIHLFPGDADVTTEAIEEWRDKLIDLGKVIPYEARGKKCLYLKNFHKHQQLRNPAAPDLPLPTWIKWQEPRYELGEDGKQRKVEAGKYIVSALYPSGTNPVSDEPEPEIEPEPEPDREPEPRFGADSASLSVPSLSAITQHYHKHIGMIGPTQFKTLEFWHLEKGMDAEVVCAAIDEAVTRKAEEDGTKPRVSYIEGILRNWYNDGIRTIDDLENLRSRASPDGEDELPEGLSNALRSARERLAREGVKLDVAR